MIVLFNKCCALKKKKRKKILRILEVIFPLFYFSKKYFLSDSEIKTMFCSSSNQILGSAVIPISVLQEALARHLLRTLGNMTTLPLFHNLSMYSGVLGTLKELKECPPSFKNVRDFLLFSSWNDCSVQSTPDYDGGQHQNNALPTQIKQLLIHLQRTYVIYKTKNKKAEVFFLLDYLPLLCFAALTGATSKLVGLSYSSKCSEVQASQVPPEEGKHSPAGMNKTQLYGDALFWFCCCSKFQGYISLLKVSI